MDTVVFVNDIGGWGGAERMLYYVIEAVNDCHPDLRTVLVVGSDGRLADKVRELPTTVEVVDIPAGRNPVSLARWGYAVSRVVAEYSANLVYLNNLRSILFASIPAAFRARTQIWHEHNIQPTPFRRVVLNSIARVAPDTIIAVSQAVKQSYFGDPSNMTVVHNGIPELASDRDRSLDLRSEYDIPSDAPVLTNPSVLQPWKGQRTFLRAAGTVSEEFPDARFLLMGAVNAEDDYRDELVQLTRSLGIGDRVLFLDFVEDVYDVYEESDVVVHTATDPDPFPTVVLEAMVAGKPVVASAVGGVPEMVVDGETGLLTPPKDAAELADRLRSLLSEPGHATRLGENARRRHSEKFSSDRFKRDVSDVIVQSLE